MEPPRPFLATRTTTSTASTVAAAAMLAIGAVAGLTTWGVLMALAVRTQPGGQRWVRVTIPPQPPPAVPVGYLVELDEPGDTPLSAVREFATQRRQGTLSAVQFLQRVSALRDQRLGRRAELKVKIRAALTSGGGSPALPSPVTVSKGPYRFTAQRTAPPPPAPQIGAEYALVYNGLAVRNVTPAQAETIARLPGVKRVRPLAKLTTTLLDAVPLVGADAVWQQDAAGEECQRSGRPCLTGAGITVGVIDTGIDVTHPDLGGSSLTDHLTRVTESPLRIFDPLRFNGVLGNAYTTQVLAQAGGRLAIATEDRVIVYDLSQRPWQELTQIIPPAPRRIPLRVATDGTTVAYYAIVDDPSADHAGELYVANLATGTHLKIADTSVFGHLSITEGRVVYTTGRMNQETLEYDGVNIAVYDLATDLPTMIAKELDGLWGAGFGPKLFNYMPVVADGQVLYQRDDDGCERMQPVVYDLATGQSDGLALPESAGTVFDRRGVMLLAGDCGVYPDSYWGRTVRRYAISGRTATAVESLPLEVSVPPFLYWELTPFSSGEERTMFTKVTVTNWDPRVILGDGVVYFNEGFGRLLVYDLERRQSTPVAPTMAARDFTVAGKQVCFLDGGTDFSLELEDIFRASYHVYCYDYGADSFDQLAARYRHPFNRKVVGGYNFWDESTFVVDDNGHGTHVAGIIAGSGPMFRGVAPQASLYAYKAFGRSGESWSDLTVAAVERAVLDGVDILNLSFGGYGDPDDDVSRAVDNAVAAGVTVVASAGNSGPGGDFECRTEQAVDGTRDSICSPGTARRAITVGATHVRPLEGTHWGVSDPRPDDIAGFSSRGPVLWGGTAGAPYSLGKPDLVAPGAIICSARYDAIFPPGVDEHFYPCVDDQHVQIAGTSMAAPMVAGAAALLKQRYPDVSPEAVKLTLMQSAVNIGIPEVAGAGRLDLRQAMAVPLFLRGDVNVDGTVSITDAISMLEVMFLRPEATVLCADAADANDDGTLNITDPVVILNFLFRPDANTELPPPGPFQRGPDPSPDVLGCRGSGI